MVRKKKLEMSTNNRQSAFLILWSKQENGILPPGSAREVAEFFGVDRLTISYLWRELKRKIDAHVNNQNGEQVDVDTLLTDSKQSPKNHIDNYCWRKYFQPSRRSGQEVTGNDLILSYEFNRMGRRRIWRQKTIYYSRDYATWTSKTRFYFTPNPQTLLMWISTTLGFLGLYSPSTKDPLQQMSAKSLHPSNRHTKITTS